MARRDKQVEDVGPDPNGWMVTFSDLITLLLTFFVLLLSMSSMDTKLAKTMFTIFRGASGVLEFASQGDPAQIRSTVKEINEALSYPPRVHDRGLASLLFPHQTEDGELLERLGGDDIQVEKGRQGLRVRFRNRIFFDAGSAELRPEAIPHLDRLAQIIRYSRFRVSVEGHADSSAVHSESFDDNWELSLARAISVVNYFTEVTHLSANRFRVGGYGSSRPLVPNDTLEKRKKNRRIEIFLYQES